MRVGKLQYKLRFRNKPASEDKWCEEEEGSKFAGFESALREFKGRHSLRSRR
jgi:hypothetical protein